jgi:hypothetical protein
MEITETVETINRQLIDLFGVDTITGDPIWRVVWSENQFEKRLMDTTDSGLSLLRPEVRLVPKYRQWIKEKYVLERLVLIPEINIPELPSTKTSYEPIFVFSDKHDNYLPPRIDVAKIVIDTVYAAQGKSSLAKYTDNPDEEQRKSVEDIYEYLYGDETDVTDALRYKTGVVVPRGYES